MLLQAVGFIGLTLLPANFNYGWFAFWLLVLGTGSGLFAAPNTTAIMNSVPPETRGVSSGMRATFQNSATLFSIGVFFSIVIAGLANAIPSTFYNGLTKYGVPSQAASQIAHLPPTAALFGAFLGYNPIGVLLPAPLRTHISQSNLTILLGKEFFPNLISSPFMVGLHAAFYISAAMCLVAAVASLLRGKRYIHGTGDTSNTSETGDTSEAQA
ncbi:MAG TPA: MFS transporter, partial [Ktedonobacterales bacterium]|nr:MFS transporter [Ktedonobacterales bacterium]